MNKQYWYCLIGGVSKDKIPSGGDAILRFPVRDAFNEVFGQDEVCASGWGIDEERYNILRKVGMMSTEELKKILGL